MYELREKARYIPNFAEVEDEYITFPHLNITQDGYLVKWIFTAEDLGQGEGRTQYPQLMILAPNSIESTAAKVHCLNSFQSVATKYLNVYEYTVDPPLLVETGYFIAIYQPPRETARMLLNFVKRAPPGTTIDLEADHPSSRADFLLQPLIHLEINSTNVYIAVSNVSLLYSPFVATMQQFTPTLGGNSSTIIPVCIIILSPYV